MKSNMKYRLSLVAIGDIIGGRCRTATALNPGVSIRHHADARSGRLLLGVLVTLALSAATFATADDKIIHVNCTEEKTLKEASHKADPGNTIRATGPP